MKKPLFLLFLALALVGHAADPSFSLLNTGTYFPIGRTLEFPYSSQFVTNLEITVSKCYVNNLNAYRLGSQDMKRRMTKVFSKRVTIDPPYDTPMNRMLRLGEMMASHEPGFYCLKVETGLTTKQGTTWWSYDAPVNDSCLFALSDLGIAAEIAPAKDDPKAVILIHSLRDGRPVEGATVCVLTRANQIAGQALTDTNGVARIPFTSSFHPGEDVIFGVMATKEKDVAYLQLDDDSRLRDRDVGEQDSLADARAFLFAERDLCRPGEAFETGLFLRSSPQGGMKALANAPVDLELWDSSGNRVETRRVTTDRWGFVAARWPIPDAARIGTWAVAAKLAGHELGRFAVNVSAYVPDRFRVTLKIGRPVQSGKPQPPTLDGAAVYYFGENVREAKWKLTVSTSLAPTLPHWQGWTVGTDEILEQPDWCDEGDITDATFSSVYDAERFEDLLESKSPVLLGFSASVTPPGARTVAAFATTRVDASDRYIGVREGTSPLKGFRTFDLAFLPVEKDAVLTGADRDEISVKLVRRQWKCHAVETHNGRYQMEWREERDEVPALARTLRAGTLKYKATDLTPGSYTLVATCGKLETHLDFWHWEGQVSDRSVSPAELNLRADTDKARPGGTVTLSFNAAYAGRAYVAVGERGIERTDSFPVRPGENRFSVRIRPDAVSRFTAVAVTLLNVDAPNARRLSGLANIRVDHADRRYPLSIDMPDTAKPGETVKVKIRTDGAGLVRLMAVDEGVLALSAFETPDPFDDLYDHDFGCPFDIHDIYSLIYPELKLLPNGQIGGGALSAVRRCNVRTRRDSTLKQRETARVVLPPVEIPASGEAEVAMTLPDFTGSMRVMAVGADLERAGSADRPVIVRDAASLFVNAPRFALSGDRCERTADIFNHDLPDSDWTLTVAGRTFSGRLAHGASTNVACRLDLPADASGPQPIDGTLKIGGETFRDGTTLTVRPRFPPTVRISHSLRRRGDSAPTAPATDDWLRLDEDTVEECGSPRSAIAVALKWLDDYPYGCLEQTAAAAFPFLVAGELRQLGLVDQAAESNATAKVKAAFGEIMQMAKSNGGFAMWPDAQDVWTDGSLFAMHFIFAAERRGLVKPDPRDPMLRWLRRTADGNDPRTRLNRAYAAYVLAVAGEDKFANAARNVLGSGTNTVDFAAFLASAALIRGGYFGDGAVTFRRAILERVWEGPTPPGSVCWSRARMQGMTLAIAAPILAASKDQDLTDRVGPLVVKLMGSLRTDASAWGTTRDNAWASAGLATFCTAFGSDLLFTRRIRSGIPKAPPARPNLIRVERDFPDRVRKGDLIDVVLRLSPSREIRYAVLCDLVPGGFELEDAQLKTREGKTIENPGRCEIRDDRWLWFGELWPVGKDAKPLELRYRLRATSRGTYTVPALTVEDMYDPDIAGTLAPTATVTVE